MKKKLMFSILCLLQCFGAGALLAETDPSAFTIINGDHLGRVTVQDIQKKYGPNTLERMSHAASSDYELCYHQPYEGNIVYLSYFTGGMGGYTNIIRFALGFERPKPGKCTEAKVNIRDSATGNGVTLNDSKKSFRSKFPLQFTEKNNTLTYENSERHTLTAEERLETRKEVLEETGGIVDRTTRIRAKFKDDKLFWVSITQFDSL